MIVPKRIAETALGPPSSEKIRNPEQTATNQRLRDYENEQNGEEAKGSGLHAEVESRRPRW